MTYFLTILLISLSFLTQIKASDEGKIRVGVVDSGLNTEKVAFKVPVCESGHIDFTPEKGQIDQIGKDNFYGHGTHVAGIIHQRVTGIIFDMSDMTTGLLKNQKN